MVTDKIQKKELLSRVMEAEQAAQMIQRGMKVALGGFTSAGYPKAVPKELAKRQSQGEPLELTFLSASMIAQLDELLAPATIRRMPLFESALMRKQANSGELHYVEQQICKVLRLLENGSFGKIDVAVMEALAITEEGYIIPTSSIGFLPYVAEKAQTIIIEINTALPAELKGLHDIYVPGVPPKRTPIPMLCAGDRFGESFIRVQTDKIKAIVFTHEPDVPQEEEKSLMSYERLPYAHKRICENLFVFLKQELPKWGGKLPPIQTGIGNLANSILQAFLCTEMEQFHELSFFCGAFHEAHMELIAAGRVREASTGSIQMTKRTIEILQDMGETLKKILVIRNIDITNDAETVGRLGLLALNTAIEADIYGNVNSSHIAGSKVVNGIGGAANFAQNAGLSMLLLPSIAKKGAVSTIVPMVSHVDITEHDVDIIITEQGIADLRGKDDLERAVCVIENCAHPAYRNMLWNYMEDAVKLSGGHHPQLPDAAFAWQKRLASTGTMLTE